MSLAQGTTYKIDKRKQIRENIYRSVDITKYKKKTVSNRKKNRKN